MGQRAWLTPVYSALDYKKVLKFAETFNYGVYYVIQISTEGHKHPWKKGDVIVAWAGDGNGSIYGLRPNISYSNTWLLDRLLGIYPDWHSGEGPEQFGRFFDEGESPDWSKVVKPKKYKKMYSSFSDLIFTVYHTMTYNCPTSWFDSIGNFHFVFYDANDILFKVIANEVTKKINIYRLDVSKDIQSHKIHEFYTEDNRTFITDVISINNLKKYLTFKPKQVFLEYLESNQKI
jgi:hypothetical protein